MRRDITEKNDRSETSLDTGRGMHQRCTGAGVSEWTPAGVLTIFENRSGAGVDFFKEGRSQFFNKRLLSLLLIIIIADCFLQSML